MSVPIQGHPRQILLLSICLVCLLKDTRDKCSYSQQRRPHLPTKRTLPALHTLSLSLAYVSLSGLSRRRQRPLSLSLAPRARAHSLSRPRARALPLARSLLSPPTCPPAAHAASTAYCLSSALRRSEAHVTSRTPSKRLFCVSIGTFVPVKQEN